ncbi:hypothetical protein AAIB41_02460 [Brucella sp. BE17]|uniref:hypothetical protein n=1 Tax=Brucella sp. BE17 TaxID=3142977 RepID=UPI0031BB6BFD
MPRPTNLTPSGQAKAERQARYRQRLQERREPEADRVDVALANAMVAFSSVVSDEKLEGFKPSVIALVRGALALLEADGFSREQSARVLRRRMSRDIRPEIADFIDAGAFDKRLKSHY